MSEWSARVLETCLQEDMSLWVLLILGSAALYNIREGSTNREHCLAAQGQNRDVGGCLHRSNALG